MAGTKLNDVLHKKDINRQNELVCSGYIHDIIYIRKLVNEFNIIECGYCILLTSKMEDYITKVLKNPNEHLKNLNINGFAIEDFNFKAEQKCHEQYDYYREKIHK